MAEGFQKRHAANHLPPIMFKGLSNLATLLKQAQNIGGQMGQLTEMMKNRRVVGSAGGGMVEIEVNGLMEVLRCRIDPQLFAGGDREMLEDLVQAAVNQAITKGKQMHAEAMRELTGGLSLPGLQEALEKFTGTEEEKKEE
jgi:DNA-binding YbaB/EbfC family protein